MAGIEARYGGGPKSFPGWVSFETATTAGLADWEGPSFSMRTSHGTIAKIFHSQLDGGTNVVVIEDIRRNCGRARTDWYFGIFEGKHSGQCENDEELRAFFQKLEAVMSRRNRVAASQLEELIQRAAGIEV